MGNGNVMLDVEGLILNTDDIRRISNPNCCGVILFARNFSSIEQVSMLCHEIKKIKKPSPLIAVDHEGGRVQRFKDGFTRIPPMRLLGALWGKDQDYAKHMAKMVGVVIGKELMDCGVDFSFIPVLDLDYGNSSVIGDRAFHPDPHVVGHLSLAIMRGLKETGSIAVGKHFPGHGFVGEDSHVEVVTDDREYGDLFKKDIIPFRMLIQKGLSAIMPAHIIFPSVDSYPVGFSREWLQNILRGNMGFKGVIFSDDLSMEGASHAGGIESRADRAIEAGCDVVLVCNDPDSSDRLLSHFDRNITKEVNSDKRLDILRGELKAEITPEELGYSYGDAVDELKKLTQT